MAAVAAVASVILPCAAEAFPASVGAVIDAAIESKVFPGAAAGFGTRESGLVASKAFGRYTYDADSPAVSLETRFDLASLTKVISTTSVAALLYQSGELGLEELVSSDDLLGPAYSAKGKGKITVAMLLTHSAGYPPDPVPGYWNESFGCPATSSEHPPLTLSCADKVHASVLAQDLENPPGSVYVYSDLSMITMHLLLGKLALQNGHVSSTDTLSECQARWKSMGDGLRWTCAYEAFARLHVFARLGMTGSGFRPSSAASTAPTWVDDFYRHELVHGVVSDENSYANGGVCGHAGLFSVVADLSRLAMLYLKPDGGVFLNETTVTRFAAVHNATQSSRALGWDTNAANNPYKGCKGFSPHTITHLGYTGTEICIDLGRGVFSVILDARVYPNKTANMDRIHTVRQQYNSAVVGALGGG